MASAVELHALTKHFGPVRAVGPVDLRVRGGELVSLLGPSGCGKTTTLRMIAGLEDPTSGSVIIDGRDVTSWPVERRGVGMVFQTYALFPHLSVYDNVAFGLSLRRVASGEVKARVHTALELVGLAQLAKRMPRELSGGQQQRVSLARSLVTEPSVLLLDEPLSNLDLKLREQMRDEIRRLQQRLGITTVYVTHDQGEALAMSDQMVVMQSGAVEQIGGPREIYEHPATSFVASFIGQCNMLTGEIIATSPNARFRTSAGMELLIAKLSDDWSTGATATLMIRPERVDVRPPTAPSNGTANCLRARIRNSIYVGDLVRLELEVEGSPEPLIAHVSSGRTELKLASGDELILHLPPNDCRVVGAGGPRQ